jgi:hypothetical protein
MAPPKGLAPPDLASLPPTPAEGLTSAEAASRLALFGRNELADKKQNKALVMFKLVRVA